MRGRRECRMLTAPAALRALKKSTQASHHRYVETIRHSLRDGFRLMARSPRGAGLDSPRPPGLLTRGLTSASGGQDHALLLVRVGSPSSDASHRVHRNPPHVS